MRPILALIADRNPGEAPVLRLEVELAGVGFVRPTAGPHGVRKIAPRWYEVLGPWTRPADTRFQAVVREGVLAIYLVTRQGYKKGAYSAFHVRVPEESP